MLKRKNLQIQTYLKYLSLTVILTYFISHELKSQTTYLNYSDSSYFSNPIALEIYSDYLLYSEPAMYKTRERIDFESVSENRDTISFEFNGRLVECSYLGDTLLCTPAIKLDTLYSGEAGFYKRPQTPKPPFPYTEKETSYLTDDSVRIVGNIMIPDGKGPFPLVVMVTGSGPQDRNSALLGHQSFYVLADSFARHGIASFRYDERGVGDSGGDFSEASSKMFAADAMDAIEAMRAYGSPINSEEVGILGHSEGGLIAEILFEEKEEPSFSILVAPPVAPLDELLLDQIERNNRHTGKSEEFINTSLSFYKKLFSQFENEVPRDSLKNVIMPLLDEYYASLDSNEVKELPGKFLLYIGLAQQFSSPWWKDLQNTTPTEYIKYVDNPVFAIFGEKDFQVSPELNKPLLEKALEKHIPGNHKIKTYQNHNHLMQNSDRGALEEYVHISETFSPLVIGDIIAWIKRTTEE